MVDEVSRRAGAWLTAEDTSRIVVKKAIPKLACMVAVEEGGALEGIEGVGWSCAEDSGGDDVY